MHVLYLHQYFVPPDGVGGTRSYEMARRLVAAGHRVTLVTTTACFPAHYRFDQKVNDLEIAGIAIKAIDVPYSNTFSFLRRLWSFIEFAVRSLAVVRGIRDADVVFATSTPLTIAVPGLFAKRALRRPLVFEVRDLWPEVPIAIGAIRNPLLVKAARALERAAYRGSSSIVALSPGMKAGVARAGVDPTRVTVIPNSSDIDLFRVPAAQGVEFLARHPYLQGGPLVLYAGTLGAANGVDYMVEIAAAMRQEGVPVRFVAVGSGNRRDLVLARAKEMGVLERNFWVLPPVQKQVLPQLLSACSMASSFVVDLPAMWDNSANKFFDAMAAGRPILINHEGWQADLLRESGAGLVVPPNDPSTAARMLADFLGDPELQAKARRAAAHLAESEFARDRLFERLLAVLATAAGQAADPGVPSGASSRP